MKIGLIADTHMPGSLEQLWPQAFDAFRGVDTILHAGDLHTLDIVDELQQLAPIYVARGNGDMDIMDDRLQDTWLLELNGIKVGMIHHFPNPERKSEEVIQRYVDRHFDDKPDVLVFGHTHFEGVYEVAGMLCVNPGSPTLPRNQSVRMGTIGLLQLKESEIEVDIFHLTADGVQSHQDIERVIYRF